MDINLKNGALTELKCQMFLIEQNCIVSKPILDNARYDLLIDINNNIYKIQIKTSRWNKEGETIVFSCKSSHATSQGNKIMKYTPEEIDYFMTEWNNKFYLIPCQNEASQFTLRLCDPNNNARFVKNVHWAEDYKAEKILQTL